MKRAAGDDGVVERLSTSSAATSAKGARVHPVGENGDQSAITLVETARALARAAARAAGNGVRREVTGAQMEVLVDLLRNPDGTVTELAERLQLARNTVSTLVGQLVRAGLVVRSHDVDDARIARLSLTPAAAERMSGWRARRAEAVRDALEVLPARDRAAIERVLLPLRALVDVIESHSHQDLPG